MQELKENKPALTNSSRSPATVAAVINENQVVINQGAQDGVRFGQRFSLYELSERDILDPTTKESLGRLETIKGTGRVVHIQDKLSILEAVSENELINLFVVPAQAKFKAPKVGDKARPI
jgi:hypothetical protein